jgi:glycosyltransferase involved in cell wall biosynthesis
VCTGGTVPRVTEISVVIPARDAAATLPRTLDALARQTLPRERFEVVVADDGSTDATGAIAQAADRVVRTAGVGPGAARNAAAGIARGRVLAFTDADCFPAEDWLARALAAIADADVVQGYVEPERPPGRFDRTVYVTSFHGLFETANLVVRRELFDALGGFEAGWTPQGGKELGEDTWLGWRARRGGARVAFAPDVLVRHAVFPRSAAGYVAERRRLTAFPALVARIPELRGALCWRRAFLTRRSAAFDAAALGLIAALAARDARPLALAAPYAAEIARDPRPAGLAADAVGAAALLAGSVRERTLLL